VRNRVSVRVRVRIRVRDSAVKYRSKSNALLYISIFLLLFARNEVKKNSRTFTCNEVLFWPFSVLLLRYSVTYIICCLCR